MVAALTAMVVALLEGHHEGMVAVVWDAAEVWKRADVLIADITPEDLNMLTAMSAMGTPMEECPPLVVESQKDGEAPKPEKDEPVELVTAPVGGALDLNVGIVEVDDWKTSFIYLSFVLASDFILPKGHDISMEIIDRQLLPA
ncbi:hypothetical protein B0H66DRAFT_613629 [Apodospora peruviana]|uniref:Uncharacterized protein n=1 Tax=Apodospora peruviana TaxID=516989 RepID=A0AAE0MG49_9PEZI|nr:hypothetical protein B0H66DRAFT_613629 [Apodospora peruviana]